ncbi:hypothetical protein F5884DRAFT_674176 [Xylogone sp. PMI_703]|nr:hypothetical protein F5884DRAFT_674176 [Xylogone sp. PMI_703]
MSDEQTPLLAGDGNDANHSQASKSQDAAKGPPSQGKKANPQSDNPGSSSSSPQPAETVLIFPPPPSHALLKFRFAIGIHVPPDPEHQPPILSNKICPPRGLYKQLLSSQRNFLLSYHTINVIYYIFVIAQLLIGATLASLGSISKLHPMAITVLGVTNSVIAGILALFKSQDLPDRVRKDEFEDRKVRDFIEGIEGMLSAGNGDGSEEDLVDELIKSVFDRYSVARDTAELNRPNSYAHQVEGNDERRRDDDDAPQASTERISVRPRNRIAIGSATGKSLQIS